MQIIDVPGVGEVEFPDEMGDAEIVAAVQRLSGPQMVASHGPPQPLPSREQTGLPESGIRGALQGASFGFGDEAAAAIDAALPSWLRNETSAKAVAPGLSDVVTGNTGDTYTERYRRARDYYRNRNAAAEESNPGTYLASQVAGAVAPTLIGAAPVAGGRALGIAAGQGAAQGAGYSDASSLAGLAGDTALGAGVGLAGYGAGKVVGQGVSALRRAAGQRLGVASARAGTQAAGEVAEDLASKAGQLGAETQKGSRYVENLMRLEESMTPQQRQLYAQLQQAGVVPQLQQSVAQGTLEALPGQASSIAAKKAALAAAQQDAPQAVASRAGELLKPSGRADARSYLKAYAEPLVWMGAANVLGETLDLSPSQQAALVAGAGVVGGRTRAGKALASRLKKPGNQAAIARAMERTAKRLEKIRRPIAAGAPAGLTAALLEDEQQ